RCLPPDNASPAHRVVPAATGHGAIDLGPIIGAAATPSEVTLRTGDGGFRRLEPPLRVNTQMTLAGSYNAFGYAFLVSETARTGAVQAVVQRRWAKSDCLPYWIVHPTSGRTERHCIPYGGYSQAEPALTRRGTAFAAEGEGGGLYLI